MTSSTDPFTNDLNKLAQDASAFSEAQKEQQEAQAAYKKQFEALLNGKDPQLVFLAMIMMFSNAGFSELDNGLGVQGSALQVQGDITKVSNDLENLSHPNSGSADASSPELVKQMASHLDQILHMLDGSSSNPAAEQIRQALGDTACNALSQQFLAIRKDIYWKEDPDQSYNPAYCADPTKASYHFDPDASKSDPNGLISNFADLQKFLGEKGSERAQDAAKLWTDAFNTNTSTTQSVQSATNEVISNDTNTIKTFQGFVAAMMHSVSDVTKSVIQNEARG